LPHDDLGLDCRLGLAHAPRQPDPVVEPRRVGADPVDAARTVRALRLLTAPGVTTVVAVDNGNVVGFAELFSDGELQAFLTSIAVNRRFRGRGIGGAHVEESLRWRVENESTS
jgi:ribosomal protein S18 acetylase RimI-like enzyme